MTKRARDRRKDRDREKTETHKEREREIREKIDKNTDLDSVILCFYCNLVCERVAWKGCVWEIGSSRESTMKRFENSMGKE